MISGPTSALIQHFNELKMNIDFKGLISQKP